MKRNVMDINDVMDTKKNDGHQTTDPPQKTKPPSGTFAKLRRYTREVVCVGKRAVEMSQAPLTRA